MADTKTDKGREAYEASLVEHPNYVSTGKPRPAWEDLPAGVHEAWRRKVEGDDQGDS